MSRTPVVAAIIVDDLTAPARLLAARRSRPAELAGRWEFPGGKVEPGEGPQEALHRELREELGVSVELGDEFPGPDAGLWPITPRHTMQLWFAHIAAGEPAPLVEHDELRWLPWPQLREVPWLEGDLPIIDALLDRARC